MTTWQSYRGLQITMILICQGIYSTSVNSTREHHMKLLKRQSHLLLRSNFFTQRLIRTFQMKLFYHPLPPLSKQALIVTGLMLDMDMNKGLEPELYFGIKAFVYIHLNNNNNKLLSINKYVRICYL